MSKTIYLVARKVTIHIEGDERSRINPGHGYPAGDETYTELIEFVTEKDAAVWILKNSRESYRVFRAEEMKATENVTITLK